MVGRCGAAASEVKDGWGDASLDVEQLALELTPHPEDQEHFPELHQVRPLPACLSISCLSFSDLCIAATCSSILFVPA